MSFAHLVRASLFLSMILGFSACDGSSSNPPDVVTCPEAEDAVLAACCEGGPDHGDGVGLATSTVTYEDCDTGEAVTVECVEASTLPEDQVIEETQQSGGEMSVACQDAIADAKSICPGYDPSSEAGALECPGDTDMVVLPSCKELQAMADVTDRCSLLDSRGWEPIGIEEARQLRGEIKTGPDDVTLSNPPGADEHDDGTEPPDLSATIRDPNRLLTSLRLEVPGNFLRYQMTEGPLRAGFEVANEMDGFVCDPDSLKCSINPLALVDLTDAIPMKNGLSANFNPVTINGLKAYRLENLKYSSVVEVTWDGHVDVMAKPIELDLGSNKTRLSLLPMHMPNDGLGANQSNSYPLTDIQFPDRQRNMIDQALIVTHLDEATCWAFTQNPSYLTYAQPTRCNCGVGPNEFGYCVTELSPRGQPKYDLLAYATTTEHAFLALCNDPVAIKPLPYKYLFEAAEAGNDPDLINMKITSTFMNYFQGYGTDEFTKDVAVAQQDVIDFGCSGRLSKYARVGVQSVFTSASATTTTGQGASSAAGVELLTTLGMGGLDVEITSGKVKFTVPVVAHFEEWVKKKFGKVIGWILKWVLKIISGIVDVAASFDMPPVGLPNAASVRLDPLTLSVQAVLSQVTTSPTAQQGFAYGVRRITTNVPDVEKDDWWLEVKWDTPNCDALTSSKTNLLEKFKALIGCPFDVLANTAAQVLSPVTTFLSKEILEGLLFLTYELNDALFDAIVTSVKSMENGNIVAQLLKDAGGNLLFEPYYLQQMGDPVKASVGSLPPILATACGVAPNPAIACALMHLMMGNGLVQASANTELLRVGAKTHFRSMDEFEDETPSYCFPPIRYCVVGDNPPGAAPFTAAQRDASQDLNEVDVAEVGGLDWHHQCAIFADFKARATGQIVTPSATYEIAVRPSARTQTLMNEIFVCRNSAYCHPTAEPNHIAERADLAACSLLADVWGHVAGSGDPYVNELFLLTTVTDPVGVAALKAVWDEYMSESDLADAGNTFLELMDFASTCQAKLVAAGYPAPPETRPISDFTTDVPYECAPTFIQQ